MTDNLDKIKEVLELAYKTSRMEYVTQALSLLDDMRGEAADAGKIIKDVLFSSGWPSIDGVVVEILQALRSSGHLKDTRKSMHPSQLSDEHIDAISKAEVPEEYNHLNDDLLGDAPTREDGECSGTTDAHSLPDAVTTSPADMPKEIWVTPSYTVDITTEYLNGKATKYTRSDLCTRALDADVAGYIKETSRLINIARGSNMADLDSWLSCADDSIKAALSLLNGEKDKI